MLEALAEAAASPMQLAKRLDADPNRVAYHMTMLISAGRVRLREARQRRGAIDHVYEVVPASSG